jgi:hypothetical protein
MKKLLIILFCVFTGFSVGQAQLSAENASIIKQYEQHMATMGDSMINNPFDHIRIRNAYLMISMLKHALLIEGSYYYKFDSLPQVSTVYPEDSTFRIFTWNLELDNGTYRHFGAIQFESNDLILTPFFDASNYVADPVNEILNKKNWYGALYYHIITRKHNGKDYYFLFGIDANDKFSNKKVIEVMTFDTLYKPVFGAPVFVYDSIDVTVNRLIIEYSKASSASLNYFDEFGKIIYDHLVPKNPRSAGVKSTYIPDGTYEGFEYKKGKWHHIMKVFHEAINENDNPPIPNPVDFDKEKKIREKVDKENKKG